MLGGDPIRGHVEAMVLGFLGSVIGVPLGSLLARGAIGAITQSGSAISRSAASAHRGGRKDDPPLHTRGSGASGIGHGGI